MYESFDYSTTTHAIPSVSEWLVYPSTISLVKLPPIEVIKLIYWLKLVEIADIIYISNKFSVMKHPKILIWEIPERYLSMRYSYAKGNK